MAKQNEFENDFTPELLDNAVLCGMSVDWHGWQIESKCDFGLF